MNQAQEEHSPLTERMNALRPYHKSKFLPVFVQYCKLYALLCTRIKIRKSIDKLTFFKKTKFKCLTQQ